MVTTLNITLDDRAANRARDVKNELGLTWAEYVEAAADALDPGAGEPEPPSSPVEPLPSDAQEPDEPGGDRHDLDIPGDNSPIAQRRREAVFAMRDRLREQGAAEKSDLLSVVDADSVGYSSPESFWSNCVKGRDTLRALPDVHPPAEGGRVWRYVED